MANKKSRLVMPDSSARVRTRDRHDFTTRAAGERDFGGLLALFEAVAAERKWIGTEPAFDQELYCRMWREIINGKGGLLSVACDRGNIVGSLCVWASSSGDCDLGMLVSQDRRGQGIGTALLREAFNWAKQHEVPTLTLGVFPHNTAAVSLYKKMGFVETARLERQKRRQTGEIWDVIVMQKPID